MAYDQYRSLGRYGSRCREGSPRKQVINGGRKIRGGTRQLGRSPFCLWIVYVRQSNRISTVYAVPGDNPSLATPAARTTTMLDLVFIAVALALFGLTVAYASACDRM